MTELPVFFNTLLLQLFSIVDTYYYGQIHLLQWHDSGCNPLAVLTCVWHEHQSCLLHCLIRIAVMARAYTRKYVSSSHLTSQMTSQMTGASQSMTSSSHTLRLLKSQTSLICCGQYYSDSTHGIMPIFSVKYLKSAFLKFTVYEKNECPKCPYFYDVLYHPKCKIILT